MSVTPEPIGTEPVEPAAGGGGVSPEPTPVADGELQAKYDALLGRISEAEAVKAENARLVDLINNRLEPTHAPPAQPDEISARMERFEQSLLYTLHNGQTESEKDAAASLLGFFQFTRGLPGQFSEQMALAPLDTATRQQVQAVMKEAASSGSRITPEFAREVVNMRNAQSELTKLQALPTPQPPNTRVVPSPVPINAQGGVTYAQLNAEWPTATNARRDELRQLERAGKIVPG